jgi:hypothetical protein
MGGKHTGKCLVTGCVCGSAAGPTGLDEISVRAHVHRSARVSPDQLSKLSEKRADPSVWPVSDWPGGGVLWCGEGKVCHGAGGGLGTTSLGSTRSDPLTRAIVDFFRC